MTTRRELLMASAAGFALQGCKTAPDVPARESALSGGARHQRDAFLPWIEVRSSALRHNVSEITRHAKVPLCACVKAGGYALGEANVAGAIDDMPGVWGYMVVRPEEAIALAQARVSKKILLLAPVDEETAVEATLLGIQLAVTANDTAAKFEQVAQRAGRRVLVHVDIDTGINRQGIRYSEAIDRLRSLAASNAVSIEGVASYFITPPDITTTQPYSADLEQIRRFESLVAEAGAAGISLGRRHMVTSISYFQYPQAYFDLVRCGALLYGGYPSAAAKEQGWIDLRLAYSLKCRLAQVTSVSAGETVGYSEKNRIETDTHLGLLMIGALDGFDHRLTKSTVVINGRSRKVLTRTGSHCVVDLGCDPQATVGDVATLIGTEHPDIFANIGGAAWANYYLRQTISKHVVA